MEAEVTTLGEKGQVVIPQPIREKLELKPRTKLLVYRIDDAIIMKKLSIPDVKKELQTLYKKIDARISKYGELTEEEIVEEMQKYRKTKRE